MRENDEKVVEETMGPEGDTIKVAPHHDDDHTHQHHDHLHGHTRTDPEKRHGDALLEGNGSRHGQVDLEPDRRA